MPRYRKLYTKTVESLDINDMPDDFTRLFWVLLPLALCREGRGLNSPAWLKSKLFPLREDINQERVGQALDWCIERGMIVAYSVDGRDYFYVPSFHKYQGSTVKEAESNYPAPPGNSGEGPDKVESRSGVGKTKVVPDRSASASASEYCILPIASEFEPDQGESNSALDAYVKIRGGAVNTLDVDQINDLVDECEAHRGTLPPGSPGAEYTGEQWVRIAILEANAARKGGMISLNYIKAILDRWRGEGFQAKRDGDGAASVTPEGRKVIKVQP